MQAFDIGVTGLDVEWRRLEVIATNLANMNSTRTAGGGSYQPLQLRSGPKVSFASHLAGAHSLPEVGGVTVYSVEPVDAPPRRVLEPTHPDADASGYVSYPGMDQAEQMTLMLKASRVYEANLVSMNMARQMYMRALDMGRK